MFNFSLDQTFAQLYSEMTSGLPSAEEQALLKQLNMQAADAYDRGDYPRSEGYYTQVLGMEKLTNRESMGVAQALHMLSCVYRAMHKFDAAQQFAGFSVDVARKNCADNNPMFLNYCAHLAQVRQLAGRG